MYYYQNVAKFVAFRAFQVGGGDYADREAAAAAASIESSLDGVEAPYSVIRSTILATAKELAQMVGSSSNALFKAALAAQSSNLADGAAVPTTDSSGNEFIGALDGFFDVASTPDRSLTEGTIQEVTRWIEDQARTVPFWKINPYKYKIDGTILRHTVTNAVARGCSWDEAAQLTNFNTVATTPATFGFVAADVSTANDTITQAAHGIFTGAKVRAVVGTGAALPSPLVTETIYYVIVDSSSTIKLATTLNNALSATAINLTTTGTNGSTENQIVTIDSFGGGLCPLPQELEILHGCKALTAMPQEGWFIPEARFYKELVADKEGSIISGKTALMTAPSMSVNQAAAAVNED